MANKLPKAPRKTKKSEEVALLLNQLDDLETDIEESIEDENSSGRLSIWELFELRKMKGQLVYLKDYIKDPTGKKLSVACRKGESIEYTVEQMVAKMDQLIELPEFRPITDPKRETLKFLVKGYEDTQKIRIKFGNRILALIKAALKIPPYYTKAQTDKFLKSITMNSVTKEYKTLISTVVGGKTLTELPVPQQIEYLESRSANMTESNPLLKNIGILAMVKIYAKLHLLEKDIQNDMDNALKDFPMYWGCLQKIKGISTVAGAKTIAYFDIFRTNSPGSYIRRLGITVEADGKGTSSRKEHHVPTEYLDEHGNVCYKWGLGYNPDNRAWYLTNVPNNFRMQQNVDYVAEWERKKAQYRLDIKHARLEKDKVTPKLDANGNWIPNDLWIDRKGRRFMLKIFLCDLWLFNAAFEGLPIKKPYYDMVTGKNTHFGKTNWDHMVARMGDPLALRYQVYGIQDQIPECYSLPITEEELTTKYMQDPNAFVDINDDDAISNDGKITNDEAISNDCDINNHLHI